MHGVRSQGGKNPPGAVLCPRCNSLMALGPGPPPSRGRDVGRAPAIPGPGGARGGWGEERPV
eukprot:5369252-Pyramimonas_sp.AAC.1